MNNKEFLNCLSVSFKTFLNTSGRSNAKLKILHRDIATDIAKILGKEYKVKALGINSEHTIDGRYIAKKVDITILRNSSVVAGIGVKFIMNNYKQNSNNYFENMLGETANIRCSTSNTPYFQIIIIPESMPYYDKNNNIKNWEGVTTNNLGKYITLSSDNSDMMYHTPNKTLLCITSIDGIKDLTSVRTKKDYKEALIDCATFSYSKQDYGTFKQGVIYNDYEDFITKVYHTVMSL